MNLKKIVCCSCVLGSIFLCDCSTFSNDRHSKLNTEYSKFSRSYNRIDGVNSIRFPEFTNPEEVLDYLDNTNTSPVNKRPFLNSDCTWTLREDTGPGNSPVISGELPDLIVIPVGQYHSTYPLGYPTNAPGTRFNYCPPQSEVPQGYNIRCFSKSLKDYADHPGPDFSFGRPGQPNLGEFVFAYVRQDVPGAAQDDDETQEALQKIRALPNNYPVHTSLPPPGAPEDTSDNDS
ncbi:MAG: hypothetical protein LBT70_02265 [Holosporaceae bacterium]|jgi:hypothetical protein|nr:hypothetical protein [Holosporaceae bacterium]